MGEPSEEVSITMPCCGVPGGWFPGFFVFMIVGMLLGLVLLVILIRALVRWLNSMAPPQPNRSDAQASDKSSQDILRERYARGEIDTATFEETLARIRGTGQPGGMPLFQAPPCCGPSCR
jgi:putative membrane protein